MELKKIFERDMEEEKDGENDVTNMFIIWALSKCC
jgi:hypothetical protein